MIDSRPEIVVEADAAAVAKLAAERVVELARAKIADNGRFTFVLSGGSTPKALFQLLAKPPYSDQIDWGKLFIFWGDERTVGPDHADSNYRMAKEALLDHVPIPQGQIFRMKGELDPDEAAAEYEQHLKQVFNLDDGEVPSFDLVLLGVGTDGHTASLFPNTDALSVADRICTANVVPQMDTTRITLTQTVLNAAENTWFLAVGKDKADAVRRGIEGEWDPTETPCQFLRQSSGSVTWLIDRAAAAELDEVSTQS